MSPAGLCALSEVTHSAVCARRKQSAPFDPVKRVCFLFSCRVGQAGSPLCNMSESCHKDCQPGEAQRVGTNEGTCAALNAFVY